MVHTFFSPNASHHPHTSSYSLYLLPTHMASDQAVQIPARQPCWTPVPVLVVWCAHACENCAIVDRWMAGNVPQLFNSNGWDFHYGILKSCMYRLLSRKRELNASHLDGTAMTIQGALGVCQSLMAPWSHDSLCRTGTIVSNLRPQSPPPYSRQSMYCFLFCFSFCLWVWSIYT